MAVKTELEDYILYGIDMQARRIYFGVPLNSADENPSDFTGASVELVIRAIHRMAQDAPNKPIELHMSSYGGDSYAMLRLHDEILSSPCQFKFYGGGAIMSSASFILAACDERYLHPHATVMIHELTDSGSVGRKTDGAINTKENERLHKVMCEIYAANSRMPIDFWDDIMQRDTYLTASEAVSLGLADKIIEPKKRGNLRKVRQAALKKEVDGKEMKKVVADIYSRIGRMKVPKLELNQPVKEAADPKVVVLSSDAQSSVSSSDSPGEDQSST